MNLVIQDADTFRKIINCLKDLITDSGEFVFNSKGISMQSTDTAKVVMIDILLNYDITFNDSENSIILPLNFINLNDILKLSKSPQIGIIYKKDSDKLTLKLNEHSAKKVQFNMTLSSNINKENLEVQEIDYNVTVYIDANELQKSIKDLSLFGKKCIITVTGEDVTLSVLGDAGDGEISLSDADIEFKNESDENKTFKGVFNMKYLNFFAKAGLSNEIILKFGNNVPFCFEYQFENGYVKFYLSQMIDD